MPFSQVFARLRSSAGNYFYPSRVPDAFSLVSPCRVCFRLAGAERISVSALRTPRNIRRHLAEAHLACATTG